MMGAIAQTVYRGLGEGSVIGVIPETLKPIEVFLPSFPLILVLQVSLPARKCARGSMSPRLQLPRITLGSAAFLQQSAALRGKRLACALTALMLTGLLWLQVSGPTIGRVIDVENMHIRKVSEPPGVSGCGLHNGVASRTYAANFFRHFVLPLAAGSNAASSLRSPHFCRWTLR